ncbi:odorant receptor 49b-like [Odontomachus brunneus]|uniref:odorant receptor 49b-like n=1 Tax=Odontomachus brunneus TaxID=486640 RepID=UPI0013F1F3B7|nr:odorant receptor 49b-like [Odontomachus brunneus]
MADTRTLEKLIAFLKADLLFACCWPLRPTATTCQRIRNKIFRWLSVLHGMVMVVVMVHTIYSNRTNVFLVMKLCCELCTTVEVPLQIVCYAIQYDRLQYVIYELEDYCKRAKPKEREVFHRYIDNCKSVYVCSICAFTVTALLLTISPLVEPHPFPMDVEYPFNVDYQPLKTIIYLHHILVIYQSYTQVCSNIFVALLLWFVSARCDILSERFRAVTKFEELRACVVEHQELLGYGKKVSLSIRYVMLASLTVSTIVIIFTGCTFLSRQPMAVKSTFLIFFISSLAKVYLCAWPADHLLSASMNITHAAYDSMWYNREVALQKNFVYTLLRGQRPVTVHVPCMLPTVSLNYYASYVTTAFSYLTSFRVLLEDDDN